MRLIQPIAISIQKGFNGSMKPTVLTLYKNIGETPLERLERLRIEDPQFKDEILSYAGRLDPMAEGLLLVLVGEENKKREEYLHLSKQYRLEILFGVSTDTYDILGLVTESKKVPEGIENEIQKVLPTLQKKYIQEYPPYSSKPVNGKPLFQWAREGRLGEIVMPTKEVEITELKALGGKWISANELKEKMFERIALMHGDFRQEEIVKSWNAFFESNKDTFFVLTVSIACSSGTYMRTFAHELGKSLGTPAIALGILREKLGNYSL